MSSKHKQLKHEEQQPVTIDPTPQVLDDQTPLDKPKKENDLEGFDKRLPTDKDYEVRIDRDRLGKKNPIVINDEDGHIGSFDDIKIEGGVELVHDVKVICGEIQGSVCVRTSASILVKRKK